MSGAVRAATDQDYSDLVLGAATPVLVRFQHGAGPDDLDLLARDLGWLTCVRVDLDRWPALAAGCSVGERPALVLFDRGAPLLVLPGDRPRSDVRAAVAAHAPG